MMQITHTYAILPVSQKTYKEIYNYIKSLGEDYSNWLEDDGMILPNVKLVCKTKSNKNYEST